MSDIDAFVRAAEAMADAVRPSLRRRFSDPVAFERKADRTPVTEADRESEATMRRMIAAAWPEHGILGEEYGPERIDAPFVWVLDPIDGTKSFVTGKPLFGTLIALTHHGAPIVGIIEMPALGERWVGAADRPTLRNGQPARIRPCPDLGEAWMYATTPEMFSGDEVAAFDRLRGRCANTLYGADLYAYGLLASGRVDVVCEASLKPYDYCALAPVVTGAGGVITDWEGQPLRISSGGRVVAAGDAQAHAAARAALAG